MQHARVRKLNSLIRDQLSAIIYTECDWTHPLVMSITEVDTAPDLSHCKIKVAMLGELEHASAPLTVSTDALGLAKCWQFYWRTASEPRAPSSVS